MFVSQAASDNPLDGAAGLVQLQSYLHTAFRGGPVDVTCRTRTHTTAFNTAVLCPGGCWFSVAEHRYHFKLEVLYLKGLGIAYVMIALSVGSWRLSRTKVASWHRRDGVCVNPGRAFHPVENRAEILFKLITGSRCSTIVFQLVCII